MPLHDHFRPPAPEVMPWPALLTRMVKAVTGRLNNQLPPPFRACESVRLGPPPEIDVSTVVARAEGADPPPKWSPPETQGSAPFSFPDCFEARVYHGPSSWYLVGAIELVSPSNKDSPQHRLAFVSRCVSHLQQGAAVLVLDIVDGPHVNLHNAILDYLRLERPSPLAEDALYAAAYRPVIREGRNEMDVWYEPCRIGADLLTMPLRLTGDLFAPVEFEFAYMEVMRSHNVL